MTAPAITIGECEICGEEQAALETCDWCEAMVCRNCRDLVSFYTPDEQLDTRRGEALLCSHCAYDAHGGGIF